MIPGSRGMPCSNRVAAAEARHPLRAAATEPSSDHLPADGNEPHRDQARARLALGHASCPEAVAGLR